MDSINTAQYTTFQPVFCTPGLTTQTPLLQPVYVVPCWIEKETGNIFFVPASTLYTEESRGSLANRVTQIQDSSTNPSSPSNTSLNTENVKQISLLEELFGRKKPASTNTPTASNNLHTLQQETQSIQDTLVTLAMVKERVQLAKEDPTRWPKAIELARNFIRIAIQVDLKKSSPVRAPTLKLEKDEFMRLEPDNLKIWCLDNIGSLRIQEWIIATATSEDWDLIMQQFTPIIKEVMVHPSGNFIVQKIILGAPYYHLYLIIEALEESIKLINSKYVYRNYVRLLSRTEFWEDQDEKSKKLREHLIKESKKLAFRKYGRFIPLSLIEHGPTEVQKEIISTLDQGLKSLTGKEPSLHFIRLLEELFTLAPSLARGLHPEFDTLSKTIQNYTNNTYLTNKQKGDVFFLLYRIILYYDSFPQDHLHLSDMRIECMKLCF